MGNMEGPIRFGTVDYVLLALMLCVSLAIGVFFAVSGRKKETRLEYLLGGRRMGAFPVCLSLFATFQSAISLLGIPTEIYSYGFFYVLNIGGTVLSYVIAMVTVVPLMFPLRVTSVYEYLARRFESKAVRTMSAVIGMVSNISYMTIALLSPALALETAVGIPLWLSIILIGAVGTFYTTMGGIKSVVWADVFQTFVIFGGIFIILVKACLDSGGPDHVWNEAKAAGRLEFDSFGLDPRIRHTAWGLNIGYAVYWVALHFSQSSVQRVVATRSIQDAYKVQIFAIPLVAVFCFVLMLTGLVMVAYFRFMGCDPLEAGFVKNRNQMVPYFVLHTLRFLPGLSGLYISTIFSGALSTLSSGINSLAANMVEDFLAGPLRNKHEAIVTSITKFFVCFFGATVIGLAYLAKNFQGPVTQIGYTVIAATNGPILGLFLLGGLFPQANHLGALAGCFTGVVINFWMAAGATLYGYQWPVLPPGPTDTCNRANTTSLTVADHLTILTSAIPGSSINGTFDHHSVTENVLSATSSLQERPFSLYDVSYIWAPVIGATVTVLVGLTISIFTNWCLKKKTRPLPKFLFPFCRNFWYKSLNGGRSESSEAQHDELDLGKNGTSPGVNEHKMTVTNDSRG